LVAVDVAVVEVGVLGDGSGVGDADDGGGWGCGFWGLVEECFEAGDFVEDGVGFFFFGVCFGFCFGGELAEFV
jgi:hypothetical protein